MLSLHNWKHEPLVKKNMCAYIIISDTTVQTGISMDLDTNWLWGNWKSSFWEHIYQNWWMPYQTSTNRPITSTSHVTLCVCQIKTLEQTTPDISKSDDPQECRPFDPLRFWWVNNWKPAPKLISHARSPPAFGCGKFSLKKCLKQLRKKVNSPCQGHPTVQMMHTTQISTGLSDNCTKLSKKQPTLKKNLCVKTQQNNLMHQVMYCIICRHKKSGHFTQCQWLTYQL